MFEFKVPDLGENIEDAEVLRVLVSSGQRVEPEQPVLEVETDKAAFEVPCSRAGTVHDVLVKEGDSIRVGQTALTLDEEQAAARQKPAPKPQPQPQPRAEAAPRAEAPQPGPEPESQLEAERRRRAERQRPERAQPQQQAVQPPAQIRPAPAAPATRRLARELGVELTAIRGTGPAGRITRDDVKRSVRESPAEARSGAPELPDFSRWGETERVRVSALGRTAAERLATSWRTIPHVTQHDLADITALDAARARYESERTPTQPKLTITSLAVVAVVAALRLHPKLNSSFDEASGEIIFKRYYNIGIAVDTDHGLLVPVVFDADRKSLRRIAAEIEDLAARARERRLSPGEMQGATFSITNLGGLGGTAFTPIINYPEVAILGLSRSRRERGDGGEGHLLLPLSLSYDHRVINGADAVRFVNRLAGILRDPLSLLLDA